MEDKYLPENIVMLRGDQDDPGLLPTRANILAKLRTFLWRARAVTPRFTRGIFAP